MARTSLNYTVDAAGFSRALSRYATALRNGQPRADIVRNQMRFAVKAMIDLTPFESLAQGRAVVRRDLLRAMHPYGGEDGRFLKIKDDGLRSRLRAYLRAGNFDAIKEIWKRIGARSSYRMEDFSEALHHRLQDSRGRVNSDHKILVPQVAAWNDYLDQLRARVGRARGGWAPAAEAFSLSLPSWITRHRSGGSITSSVTPGSVTGLLGGGSGRILPG